MPTFLQPGERIYVRTRVRYIGGLYQFMLLLFYLFLQPALPVLFASEKKKHGVKKGRNHIMTLKYLLPVRGRPQFNP